jgi:hypothetical protein
MSGCQKGRLFLWLLLPLVGGVTTIAASNAGASLQTSEIDGYESAVTMGTKEATLAFIHEFPTSHLVGDVIESLNVEVARDVCASLSGNFVRARRACDELQKKKPAAERTAGSESSSAMPRQATVPPVSVRSEAAPPIPPLKPADAPQIASLPSAQIGTATAPASAKTAAVMETAANPTFQVQLLSTKSAAETRANWQQLQAAHGDLLANLELTIWKVDLGVTKGGLWYRGLAGPLASRDEAVSLCNTIKARLGRNACLVIAP